ncbi:MAG: SURF1 family protein [Pseudomonadota bacterium]
MPALIGIVGTGILIWLGVWQLQRLEWKKDVLAQIDDRMQAVPIALPPEPNEADHRFQPVAIRGTADTDQSQFIFTSVKNQGVWFRLIQPLDLVDGRRVLVERGLVRPESIETLDLDADIAVSGSLHWPDEADAFTPDPDPVSGQWYARDLDALADVTGAEPILVVASQVIPSDDLVLPFPLDPSGIPNDHLQYAVTWFGLALVWVGMTGLWLKRLYAWRHLDRRR